jgi:hypothetical protein
MCIIQLDLLTLAIANTLNNHYNSVNEKLRIQIYS